MKLLASKTYLKHMNQPLDSSPLSLSQTPNLDAIPNIIINIQIQAPQTSPLLVVEDVPQFEEGDEIKSIIKQTMEKFEFLEEQFRILKGGYTEKVPQLRRPLIFPDV